MNGKNQNAIKKLLSGTLILLTLSHHNWKSDSTPTPQIKKEVIALDRGVDVSNSDQTFFRDWSFNTFLGSIEYLERHKKKKKQEEK